MTVGELIAKLQEFPSEMRVLVDGYEMGFDNPYPPRIETAYFQDDEEGGVNGTYWRYTDCWESAARRATFQAVVVSRGDKDE
jgi:hypothetical protein